jgi:sarcosine reductase
MRLEQDILKIKGIQFDEKTEIIDGVIRINRAELQNLLLEESKFDHVDIELARPRENCRIVQVHDVIEPRARKNGSGEDFPGALGKQGPAGEGRTCVLRGAAVVLSDCSEEGHHPTRDPNGHVIDMSGAGAEIGIYGKTFNIVVLPFPADGVSPEDYRVALTIAGLKTASYLAKAGHDIKPDEKIVYELSSTNVSRKGMENLPRVAYIFQMLSMQWEPIPGEPVLYGTNIEGIVPTILHPNEVLDGAVLCSYLNICMETYVVQNHPVIEELYRKHGKELYFAGVIISTAHNNPREYERSANIAANLCKWVLGADGAVLTKAGGGAPEIAMAQTARMCERLGIKTTLAVVPMTADLSDARSEASIIFNYPELNAIVSMGNPSVTPVTLPEMERVIGRAVPTLEGLPVSGEHVKKLRWIKGGLCQLGNAKFTAVRY